MPKTKFWHCKSCKKQFSVTAGTPMHRTHLPLLTWAHAIYLIVSSSKGISAVKLSEMLGISYPSAWHLGHRVRAMMAEANPILSGEVEIDEMYAGAPPRKRVKSSRDHDDDDAPPANRKGRGIHVLVAAKRDDDEVAKVIPTHGKGAVAAVLVGVIDDTATVMTDGLPAYKHIGKTQSHLAVDHSAREYARTDEATGHRGHVNRVESFNGFMRQAVTGVFHSISVKHLGRYTGEAKFSWNRRAGSCLDLMARMIRNGEGRLLSYSFLTGKAA